MYNTYLYICCKCWWSLFIRLDFKKDTHLGNPWRSLQCTVHGLDWSKIVEPWTKMKQNMLGTSVTIFDTSRNCLTTWQLVFVDNELELGLVTYNLEHGQKRKGVEFIIVPLSIGPFWATRHIDHIPLSGVVFRGTWTALALQISKGRLDVGWPSYRHTLWILAMQ